MATPAQAHNSFRKYVNGFTPSTPALQNSPQVNGIITSVTTMSPNNPNSAMSHIAKVRLTNQLRVTARIPGISYICSNFNSVLVNGGRANDLPGVGYTLISGVNDFSPVIFNNNSRSIYGTSSPEGYTKFVSSSLSLV